jgi:hypothetical protein
MTLESAGYFDSGSSGRGQLHHDNPIGLTNQQVAWYRLYKIWPMYEEGCQLALLGPKRLVRFG